MNETREERRWWWGGMMALGFLALTCAGLRAQTEPAGVIKGRTAYLEHPVAGGHVLTFFCDARREAEVRGWIEIDPNRAQLGPFGDPRARTRMAGRTVEFKAHRLRLGDPRGRRALYRLEIALPGKWAFVRPLREGAAPRLVVRTDEKARVLTLEPAPELSDRRPVGASPVAPPVPPELQPQLRGSSLRGVSYEVRREGKALFLLANGQAPTPGYRIALLPRNRSRHCRHFELSAVPPGGVVAQVLTPYSSRIRIHLPPDARVVRVLDADGEHAVAVPSVR